MICQTTDEEEYQPNTNANSFLTHEILKLLGKEKVHMYDVYVNTLDVENNHNLIKLYEKFGFVQKGENEFGDIHMEAIVNKASVSKPAKITI